MKKGTKIIKVVGRGSGGGERILKKNMIFKYSLVSP